MAPGGVTPQWLVELMVFWPSPYIFWGQWMEKSMLQQKKLLHERAEDRLAWYGTKIKASRMCEANVMHRLAEQLVT